MEINAENLGQRIAKRRKSLKIKQHILAEKIGISNNYLSSIERGKDRPSLDVFVAICNVLKVTPDYLLLGTMHSNNVPQDIMEKLRLCSPRDVQIVSQLVEILVNQQETSWNDDNFI
ncbi:MAG: helix-turn-helix domain-containing protein [Massiliimalia sp.]